MGVGGDFGCVQYGSSRGRAPYRIPRPANEKRLRRIFNSQHPYSIRRSVYYTFQRVEEGYARLFGDGQAEGSRFLEKPGSACNTQGHPASERQLEERCSIRKILDHHENHRA